MTSSVRPPLSKKELTGSIGANKTYSAVHLKYTERRSREGMYTYIYIHICICLQVVTLLGVISALRNYCRK